MRRFLPFKKTFLLFLPAILCVPALTKAQWSAKKTISPKAFSAFLNENMGPCLAVSGDSLYVTWSDKRTTGSGIFCTHSYDTGATWSPAVPLTDTLNGKTTFPAIAVSGRNVHVVFLDTLVNGDTASFYMHSTDGGNTWSTPYCLDSNTKFWPGVAAHGALVVVSLNKSLASTNTEVFFRRSTDNGNNWDPEQQISNAPNRSEDPAINTDGKNVFLSWNDKRSGQMLIYYRRSTDMGLTWGPETARSYYDSYTSMVSLNHASTDVPYGSTLSGHFEVWLRQSHDSGTTFDSAQQLTNNINGDAYPYLVRDSSSMHLVYLQFGTGGGPLYIHSGDGGTTWDPAVSFGSGGQPFIVYTSCMLHVIFPDSGKIYYTRNPTGNGDCSTSAIAAVSSPILKTSLSANPSIFNKSTSIEYSLSENGNVDLEIYDINGRIAKTLVNGYHNAGEGNTILLDSSNLAPGMYFCRLITTSSEVSQKIIITH